MKLSRVGELWTDGAMAADVAQKEDFCHHPHQGSLRFGGNFGREDSMFSATSCMWLLTKITSQTSQWAPTPAAITQMRVVFFWSEFMQVQNGSDKIGKPSL